VPDRISKWCFSGTSYAYKNRIVLRGRLSVITFLHEYAHILFETGNQDKAQKWALDLFKEVFPEQYAKLKVKFGTGYALIKPKPFFSLGDL